jgi:glucose/mannose-6-phosphate isomerase
LEINQGYNFFTGYKNKNMDRDSAAGFRKNILDSTMQFAVGFEIAKEARVAGEFQSIVLSGMGGSALPGGLLSIYLGDVALRTGTKEPAIIQNRTYALPLATKNPGFLHLICSYSGNTEETISCLEEAITEGLPCIGVSAGGRIAEICKAKNVPHIRLPIPTPTFQPRMGSGYFFASLLEVMINHGLVPDVRAEVLAGAQEVTATLTTCEAEGKELAKRLIGKTPVIYSSAQYGLLASVWKIKINENAKTPAFWNMLPEMNHNEMVGYTLPQGAFHVVLLRDPEDHPKNKKRYDVLLPLLAEKGVTGEIIDMKGERVYNRIFNTLLLGDFMAYYLALEYLQDPEPVAMVEAFKKLLVE